MATTAHSPLLRPALGALAAALLILPAAAQAQEPPLAQERAPRIIVTGKGEAAIAPDMALITLGVMREAETARAALDEANGAIAAVIASAKEAGIAERDMQTTGLSIQPRYVHPRPNDDGSQPPRIVGYQVMNNVTLRVRDIANVGAVIDRAVTDGANQGGSIVFVNDDPAQAQSQARRKAVEDAMTRAGEMADAAGLQVGRVLEMSERGAEPPRPFDGRMMRMEAQSAAAAVPIEAGETIYRVEVTMTLSLEQEAP